MSARDAASSGQAGAVEGRTEALRASRCVFCETDHPSGTPCPHPEGDVWDVWSR